MFPVIVEVGSSAAMVPVPKNDCVISGDAAVSIVREATHCGGVVPIEIDLPIATHRIGQGRKDRGSRDVRGQREECGNGSSDTGSGEIPHDLAADGELGGKWAS